MPKFTIPESGAFKIIFIESERGWGSKIIETEYYDNETEARQVVADYNKKHNSAIVTPDWYIKAEYAGRVL